MCCLKMRSGRALLLAAIMLVLGTGCGHDRIEQPKVCAVETLAEGLSTPYDVLRDGDGYLVTVDGGIVRLDGKGGVKKIASISERSFGGVARLGSDLIIIDNRLGHLIRATPSGVASTYATGIGNGINVVPDGNDLIVTDYDNHVQNASSGRLLRVSPDGMVSVIAQTGLGGTSGLAVLPDGYYVTDFVGGRLMRVSRQGEVQTVFQGLGQPVDVARHGDYFYVTDYAGGSSGGRIVAIKASLQGPSEDLPTPSLGSLGGLTIDGEELFVSDVTGGKVHKLMNCLR